MKSYKTFLLEKVNYQELINPRFAELCRRYLDVDFRILFKKSDEVFKHRDKMIVFFFKHTRDMYSKKLSRLTSIEEIDKPDVAQFLNKYGIYNATFSLSNLGPEYFLETFKHYYSLNYYKINDYTPQPSDKNLSYILDKFHEFELEWREKFSELTPDQVRQTNGWKSIIKFPDGYEWFDLGKAYCDNEGKSGGHCGNAPARGDHNQTILSLKQKITNGNHVFWKFCLTFIYHKNEKSLGEMKGKNNTKPSSKYHSYIVKLLEHPMIQGIHGGGYLPENNFSVMDLPPSIYNRLIDSKPNLVSILEKIESNIDISFDELYEEFLKGFNRTSNAIILKATAYMLFDNSSEELEYVDFLNEYYDPDALVKEIEAVLDDTTLEKISDYVEEEYNKYSDTPITHLSKFHKNDKLLKEIYQLAEEDIDKHMRPRVDKIFREWYSENITVVGSNNDIVGGETSLSNQEFSVIVSKGVITSYILELIDAEYTPTSIRRSLQEMSVMVTEDAGKIEKLKYSFSDSFANKVSMRPLLLSNKIDFLSRQKDMFGNENLNYYKNLK